MAARIAPSVGIIAGDEGLWNSAAALASFVALQNIYTYLSRVDWRRPNHFKKFISPVLGKEPLWEYQSLNFKAAKEMFNTSVRANIQNSGDKFAYLKVQDLYRKESARDTSSAVFNFFKSKDNTLDFFVDEIIFTDPVSSEPVYTILIRGTDHKQ